MTTQHVRDLIVKNPVNKALEYSYVDEIMRGVIRRHFPDITNIVSLNHYKYKRRVGRRNSTFIYNYTARGITADGARVIKRLIYSAHSDGSRLRAHTIIRALIEAGFNRDAFRVLKPLEYLPEVQALIYEKVPGKTFISFMRNQTPVPELQPLFVRIAAWLYKFHTFPVPDGLRLSLAPFDPSKMNLTTEELLTGVAAINAHQAEKLEALLTTMFPLERQLSAHAPAGMVYGDLHPENIIIRALRGNGLTMIDFTDVAWGDQLRDCGAFIQQLHFMGKELYTPDDLRRIRTLFLEQYFKRPLTEVSDDIYARLNLYQAWNSLRGFMYFFFQDAVRDKSYGLLEEAWLYLTLARDRSRSLFIKDVI